MDKRETKLRRRLLDEEKVRRWLFMARLATEPPRWLSISLAESRKHNYCLCTFAASEKLTVSSTNERPAKDFEASLGLTMSDYYEREKSRLQSLKDFLDYSDRLHTQMPRAQTSKVGLSPLDRRSSSARQRLSAWLSSNRFASSLQLARQQQHTTRTALCSSRLQRYWRRVSTPRLTSLRATGSSPRARASTNEPDTTAWRRPTTL